MQHTIKIKFNPLINVPLSLNKEILINYKKEDRFNRDYGSDGEPGPFCDMEYIEDTQYSDDYALPKVLPPSAGFFFSDYEGN